MHGNEIVYPLPIEILARPALLVKRGVLTPDECDQLIRFGEPRLVKKRAPRYGEKVVEAASIAPDDADWLYHRMAELFATNNCWGLHLTGLQLMSILKYRRGGCTRMHVDYKPHSSNFAKITAIAQLVDSRSYIGGQLHVSEEADPVSLERGDCVLFPSFVLHGVTRVQKGSRLVLAAWAAGLQLV